MMKALFLVGLLFFAGCGKDTRDISEKNSSRGIFQGQEAEISDFEALSPVVKLQFPPSFTCTGTYLGERKILTAAHCVNGSADKTGNSLKAMAVSSPLRPNFKAIIPAKDLEIQFQKGSDIVVITILGSGLGDLERLPSAELGTRLLKNGSRARIAGYGRTTPKDSASVGKLRLGEVTITNWNSAHYFTEGNLENKLAGALPGDSGGPLFLEEDGKLVVYGVISKAAVRDDESAKVLSVKNTIARPKL
jgi:hypothetical protein